MMKIRPIGRLLKTDSEEFIISESSVEKIKSPWKEALEDIKNEIYLSEVSDIIHSIYVRGTVSRGEALEGISDIDTFAVVTKPIDSFDRTWVKDKRIALEKKYPFCDGIEIRFIYKEDLITKEDFYNDRFLIKTQSACIYGDDLSKEIQPFKADKETSNHFHQNLEELFNNAKKYILENKGEEDLKDTCRWIMKRILRIGFVLVMNKEKAFTRDLYPCYEIFSKYYPEKEEDMYKALDWALNPTTDEEELIDFLNSFGVWIKEERDRIFS